MEQRALKNVDNCLNTNIYSYLETSGGKSYKIYLNTVHFFNTSVKTVVLLHWYPMSAVLLERLLLVRLSSLVNVRVRLELTQIRPLQALPSRHTV